MIDRLTEVYEVDYANVHRGIHSLSERSTELYEDARQRVAQFIGAASAMEEIIFTQGTTAAINLVARSWGDVNTSAGDEIVLTEMEHHSNIVPWQQLAERTGIALKYVPFTEDGRLDLVSFDEMLTEKTKLVAVTAMSNVLGTINPIDEIVQRAHAVGALVMVDAAQSVPHLPRMYSNSMWTFGRQRPQDARPFRCRVPLRQASAARRNVAVLGWREHDSHG